MHEKDDIVHITVGTAGHIDHGKSTLIKAITGTDPDRLKEEQERGMTIDLGYAGLELPDGREVGIIDVPGHEKFIKNMVAGASGIDFVLLVVAADDSVMPQTREHLEIMEILGVRRGMTVINKIDLVDEELVELVEEDVRDFLKGTFLEDSPVMRVSAVNGDGIPEFLGVFRELVQQVEPRSAEGVFRMPVQRVFSAKGYGAVVTGVPVSGSVKEGDRLEVLPQGTVSRVRGIQVYGRQRGWARSGHRTALNLADVSFHKVARGDVVCEQDCFEPTKILDGRFQYLPDQKGKLGPRTNIRMHIGTAEALGVMVLLDRNRLLPGESAYVQYRLQEPVVAGIGDRCVIRLQSPLMTIGGGPVLGSARGRPRQLKSRIAAFIKEKDEAAGSEEKLLGVIIKEQGANPVEVAALKRLIHLPDAKVRNMLGSLVEKGEVLALPKRARVIHSDGLSLARERLLGTVEKYFKSNPLRVFCDIKHLVNLTHMDEDVLYLAAGQLESMKKIEVTGGKLTIAGRQVRLNRDEEDLASEMEKIYLEERFSGPSFGDLVARVKGPQDRVKKVFDFLLEKGDIVRIGDNTYIHKLGLEEAREAIRNHFKTSTELSPADMKNLIGTTRKFAIPLMEHFDRQGLTVRKGNVRVLA